MEKEWLRDWPWEIVIAINEGLCKPKGLAHRPNPEGFEPARRLWEQNRGRNISLADALGICRQAHQFSPFTFFNGNTFVAIGRTLVQEILRSMAPDKAQIFRSVVGHYIAGTVGERELKEALSELEPLTEAEYPMAQPVKGANWP